jgi:hypothetical protein
MKKIKELWPLILLGISLIYISYVFLKKPIRDYSINKNSKIIKGIVTNERNYLSNDKVEFTYTYSYKFKIGKEIYRSNSYKKGLTPGDSILIEYNPKFPIFNRVLNHNTK